MRHALWITHTQKCTKFTQFHASRSGHLDTFKDLTPHMIDMIADMAAELDATLDTEEMETAVNLVENVGTRLSHREMQMVKQMAQSANITLTTKDVQIINEMVKMIGPDVTKKEAELIAVLANKGMSINYE